MRRTAVIQQRNFSSASTTPTVFTSVFDYRSEYIDAEIASVYNSPCNKYRLLTLAPLKPEAKVIHEKKIEFAWSLILDVKTEMR